MKVLYVLNSTYAMGGASKSFVTMAAGMMEKGITPVVVVPDKEGLYADLVERGMEVHVATYRINTYPLVRTPKDALLFLPRLIARRVVNRLAVNGLAKSLAGKGIALVHANVSVVDIGFRLSRRLGVPHIYHFREYGDLDFKETYFPSWKAFHKTLTAPQSYAIGITKGILAHHGLAHCAHARVIYNGFPSPKPQEAASEGKGYFLYAGRLEEAKGVDVLLEAYARYLATPGKRTPLWIAGDSDDAAYKRRLADIVRDGGLDGQVRFLGGRTDVAALMGQAKALVVTSRMEAFGRCMAEAMFNRCLVVGLNTGGTREQFDNGLQQTGAEIGIRVETAEALPEALAKVDTMPQEEKEAMLERALTTVGTLYTEEAYISNIHAFYRDILNENAD